MPKIYSEEKKKEIRKHLMETGLELIKHSRIKKMSIEELTKKVGIAQGTFYNFFNSKEMLVYELSNAYHERLNKKVEEIVKSKGFLDREDLHELYYNMFLKDEDNVYRFLKNDDIQILFTKLPSDYLHKIADVKQEIEKNLSYVKREKNNCDLNAIINWIQVLNLTIENKDILQESGIEKIINKMIENMLDEIF